MRRRGPTQPFVRRGVHRAGVRNLGEYRYSSGAESSLPTTRAIHCSAASRAAPSESDGQRHLAEPRSRNVLPFTGTNSQS